MPTILGVCAPNSSLCTWYVVIVCAATFFSKGSLVDIVISYSCP